MAEPGKVTCFCGNTARQGGTLCGACLNRQLLSQDRANKVETARQALNHALYEALGERRAPKVMYALEDYVEAKINECIN